MKILEFKNSLNISDEQILGIGFAMQALITPDKKKVLYGKILNCTSLSIDAFYLSISNHLGAAIISNGKILDGKHGHSATIEHITMEPDGAVCYCGKKGCMETLCSLNALLDENEPLEDFFSHLRQNESDYVARWKKFLINLSKSVNNLHLVYDTDFILGGYIAPFLINADLDFILRQIADMTPFPEYTDFILIRKMPKHNISIGAAMPYIQEFLNTLTTTIPQSGISNLC